MRFLSKTTTSQILSENLKYSISGQRNSIRQLLINEQKGFCAYSERFIKNTDSVDIEHFDPRLKDTAGDNYYNWYATLRWLNHHKPYIIDPFLPILTPYADDLNLRIKYDDGVFTTVNSPDTEAQNLIDFLGVNKNEVYMDRIKHVNRISSLKSLCGADNELFLSKMVEDQDNLSFATAIEHKFKLNVDELIEKSRGL